MNKICTSLEQSKKLIELGIDINTADMYWWYNGQRYYVETKEHNDFRKSDISAWSLSALLELMPTKDKSNEYYVTTESHSDYYQVNYVNCWNGNIYETDSDDCLIDAAFKMVVWLKENDKL